MRRLSRFCVLALCLALAGCQGEIWMPSTPTPSVIVNDSSPTPIPIPSEKAIVTITNEALERLADPLSQTLDADYKVLDVHFTITQDGQSLIFLIEARCQCANNTNCCTLERTFVTVVNSMKVVFGKIAVYIPPNVDKVHFSCEDHNRALGIVETSWNDMQSYFTETIDGGQFGSRVRILPAP